MKNLIEKIQQIDDCLIIKQFDSNDCSIYKKKGAIGNFIPEWRKDSKKEEDCPWIELKIKNNTISLINWVWAPGPGPGEFWKDFNKEQDVVDFIKMYYFEENDLFNARIDYENNVRRTYNFTEIKEILSKLSTQLIEISDSEIHINERGHYYKIPFENWSIIKREDEERPTIKAKKGLISYDLMILRKNLKANENYDLDDIEAIANLFLDICNNLKKTEKLGRNRLF